MTATGTRRRVPFGADQTHWLCRRVHGASVVMRYEIASAATATKRRRASNARDLPSTSVPRRHVFTQPSTCRSHSFRKVPIAEMLPRGARMPPVSVINTKSPTSVFHLSASVLTMTPGANWTAQQGRGLVPVGGRGPREAPGTQRQHDSPRSIVRQRHPRSELDIDNCFGNVWINELARQTKISEVIVRETITNQGKEQRNQLKPANWNTRTHWNDLNKPDQNDPWSCGINSR